MIKGKADEVFAFKTIAWICRIAGISKKRIVLCLDLPDAEHGRIFTVAGLFCLFVHWAQACGLTTFAIECV